MYIKDHLSFWIDFLTRTSPLSVPKLNEQDYQRLDHYFKISTPFQLNAGVPVNHVPLIKKTGYAYDWYRIFDRSDNRACLYLFGDIQYTPEQPTFCKSRPLGSLNDNNVLLPLNTVRHLKFMDDRLPFEKKRNNVVWRGAVYKDHRKKFLGSTQKSPFCDVCDTSLHTPKNWLGQSINFLSIEEQLKSKFIFAIEGNDVASNLKWIMHSNSIPVMPRPRFETWACEGLLVAGQHFIEIADDFANIDDTIEYYLGQPKLLAEINTESKQFISQFTELDKQFALAKIVADRYFAMVV